MQDEIFSGKMFSGTPPIPPAGSFSTQSPEGLLAQFCNRANLRGIPRQLRWKRLNSDVRYLDKLVGRD
jgi:hypothetical protein